MTHDPVYKDGVTAGYGGKLTPFDCPYCNKTQAHHEARAKWMAGYTAGQNQRRVDQRDGRYCDPAPTLPPRPKRQKVSKRRKAKATT